MNCNLKYFNLIALIIALDGCSSGIKEKFGIYDKAVPNEFAVMSHPSLSIPPKYELIEPNKVRNKRAEIKDAEHSKAEEFLLNKIEIDHNYSYSNSIKNNANKEPGFFKKLFNRHHDNSKDATENSAANIEDRTYKSKSLQLMKTDNNSNRKICNISNGEVVYCDKNTFMKNFSFPATTTK